MVKYFIGVVIFSLVAVGAYYAWDAYSSMETEKKEPVPRTEEGVANTPYATSTFSIEYPENFSVNDSYAYEGVPNKPIDGVKFTVPASMTTGTNLASDSGVSVEWLPRAANCTGDIYMLANVRAFDLTVGSTTYSVATTSEAAAGSLYEEQIYAVLDSEPCTAMRYFIHSMNISNFSQEGEETVREFDRNALLRAFDSIRDSLTLTP